MGGVNLRKINDRIALGLLVGLLGSIPKSISNEYFYRKGIEKKRYGNIVSGVFMPKNQAQSKSGVAFGAAGDLLMSSLLGIPLVYLLSFTGKDHHVLKGLVVGNVGFGGFRGLMANVGPGKTYPKDPTTNALMTWASSLWGVTAGILATVLGDESLFKPNPGTLDIPDKSQKTIASTKDHKDSKDV